MRLSSQDISMNLTYHDAAGLLLNARRSNRKIPASDIEAPPAGLRWAYAVQEAVTRELGAVGAFKTGRKTADEIPIMAPILAAGVRASPATFTRAELDLVGVELEVAFRIDAVLPNLDDPDFETRMRERVSVLPAIEVVDSRIADHDTADPLWKLADNQINAGLVHGEPLADWQALDLAHVAARLEAGRDILFEGPAMVPGGDAFATLCAFVRLVGAHCGGLHPGQFVTTGSVMGLIFIEPGQRVHGTIEGLGSVEAEFL